ncbi:MAG: ATP-binding protein [Myxococcales bacterium]|nr:ATP-binding protein [Myxococcales bacterium]
MAVVSLVVQVRAQKKETLILLDEPEVSLHPAAQKRLLHFLLEECRKQHHQVVFTTHSPPRRKPTCRSHQGICSRCDRPLRRAQPKSTHMPRFIALEQPHPSASKCWWKTAWRKHIVDLASKLLPVDERATFDVDFLPRWS